jgi:alkanesulfonate monooxygenase SsuD/methylene tetrahydromethanopterin reductase-like flavin-dependent oxidoreductase (luciferase family)
MEFWQSLAFVEPDQVVGVARCAEEVGFTGVGIDDHLVTPARVDSEYPYPATMARLAVERPEATAAMWDPGVPHLEPWSTISVLGHATSRLRFLNQVFVLPMRDPFTVAKLVSTASVFAPDRIVFGVGVGWMAEEFALTGQEFHNRGKRTDEMLEVIATLLRGGMQEYHGQFYDFDAMQMAPAPAQPVPVYVGGDSRAAMERAGRHQGWLGVNYDFDDALMMLKRLDDLARPGAGFGKVLSVNEPPTLDELRGLADAGCTGIMNPPWLFYGIPKSSLDYKCQTLHEYAERVIKPAAQW